jgi:hypothetical protein
MPTLGDLGGGPSWLAGAGLRPTTTLSQLGAWRAPVFSNPALVDALMRYTRAEVGGQGPQAQQAFMEAMTNMGGNRGQFLPRNYFPDITHRRAARPLTEAERAQLQPIADLVAGGSNIADYATGNASGTVGFGKGGYRTASYGGENYGVEAPDRGWWQKLGLEGPKAPGSVGYVAPGNVPTGATTTAADLIPPPAPRNWGDIVGDVLAGMVANMGRSRGAQVAAIPEFQLGGRAAGPQWTPLGRTGVTPFG